MEVKIIPHDFEAEQAILGSVMVKPSIFNIISKHCSPNTFHSEPHRHIFRAICEVIESFSIDAINEITVGDQLKKFGKIDEIGGYGYLGELTENIPSAGNPEYWAVIIKNHALMRDMISLSNDISRKCRDPQQSVMDLLQEAIDGFNSISGRTNTTSSQHIKEVLKESFIKLEEISGSDKTFLGSRTGFIDLDRIISGLIPKDLIILAARPGMGKTALALNISTYAARSGTLKGNVLFFSREMANTQLGNRTLSAGAKIDSRKIKTGELDQEQWDKMAMATDRLCTSNLYLNDKIKDINDVIHEVNRLDQELEGGIGLVVVDYLQKFKSRGKKTKFEEVSDISGKLKDLALDNDIPVIALCQLNRAVENRSEKIPQLSDLRDSGEIEQDADIILFIYRDEVYNEDSDRKGTADLIIAKHRNGPLGVVTLLFHGKHTSFYNISDRPK